MIKDTEKEFKEYYMDMMLYNILYEYDKIGSSYNRISWLRERYFKWFKANSSLLKYKEESKEFFNKEKEFLNGLDFSDDKIESLQKKTIDEFEDYNNKVNSRSLKNE